MPEQHGTGPHPDLAGEIDGALVSARAAYANAPAARNSTGLDKVSRDFENLGAILYAAEASAEAAVILRRAGKPRDAAAQQKAVPLLARCEGAVPPPGVKSGPNRPRPSSARSVSAPS